ncbi:hypothetical protein BDR04DRAFT_248860 [Suillus decipiens]|nr:hypothetical protein BDR04DRAFT_248860 [Suillus decipiens]
MFARRGGTVAEESRLISAAFEFNLDSEFNDLPHQDDLRVLTYQCWRLLDLTPFEGHTKLIRGLALSFDSAILASASPSSSGLGLPLSSSSLHLIYTNDYKICICDTPPGILAQATACMLFLTDFRTQTVSPEDL